MFDNRSPIKFCSLAAMSLWLIVTAGAVGSVIAQPPPETRIGKLSIVVVKADVPTETLGTLYKVLKAERAKGPTELEVGLPGAGLNIAVAPEPVKSEMLVYPNPLFLVVSVDEKGMLGLNGEKRGRLANLVPMQRRLEEIFKAREVNGVFRPGTNDVERTVSVRAHESLKVSDLDKVVAMLDVVGADRLILLIDPEPEPELELITLPELPRIQKKKRKS